VPNLVREILDDVFVSSDATEELEHLADDVELGVVHPLRGSEKKKKKKKKEGASPGTSSSRLHAVES
jgi:hypothetical protein